MELEVKTTSRSGGTDTPFRNVHGLDASEPISIDAADLDAGDYPDGYLPAGFPLGFVTASSTYAKYDVGNADGTETGVGVLRNDLPIASATSVVAGAMVRHCFIDAAKAPVALTSAFLADVPTIVVV